MAKTYSRMITLLQNTPLIKSKTFQKLIAKRRPNIPWPEWVCDAVDRRDNRFLVELRECIMDNYDSYVRDLTVECKLQDNVKLRVFLNETMGRNIFRSGCYEPNIFAYLKTKLKEGMVFLDVGANFGLYTVWAARQVGRTGKVISLEPSTRDYDRLQYNVRLNSLKNVQALPVGASDSNRMAKFHISGDDAPGQNTLGGFVYQDVSEKQTVDIQLKKIDDILSELRVEHVDVVKIDVEGHEYNVLKGMRSVLERDHPVLVVETQEQSLQKQNSTTQQIFDFLLSLGYQPQEISKNTGKTIPAKMTETWYDNNIIWTHTVKMKEKLLVSIVTPCFNSVRFIRNCIDSVCSQDYPYIEHIIQDSASTDGTVDILHEYDGKVDWVSEQDRGQADGLDRALKRCRGDIILVLNADDILIPHAVAWGVENMTIHHDVAVIYGDEYIIDGQDRVINQCFGPDPYDYEKLFCIEQVLPAQAAFIRRTYFEQVGLGTFPDLATCPDYEMWVRIGRRFPMTHVPGFIGGYRWHDSSEGRHAAIVKKMVDAKRLIMDKVMDDPAAPSSVRSLRRRAHAGLNIWAAEMFYNANVKEKSDVMSGIISGLKGAFLFPQNGNMKRGVSLSLLLIRKLGKLPDLLVGLCLYLFWFGSLPFVAIKNRQLVSNKVLLTAGLVLFFGGSCGIIAVLIFYNIADPDWKIMILSNWLLTLSGLILSTIGQVRHDH
jgi:FkbM family methyltransferase